MAKTHKLKIYTDYYDAVADGSKSFELRRNDREYFAGDLLELREVDPDTSEYTGRACHRLITYVFDSQGRAFGLERGWCILSLAPCTPLARRSRSSNVDP